MENKGSLVSKKLTFEFIYEGNYYTIDETESYMEYEIEVFDSEGQEPSNVDDILEAFETTREQNGITDFYEGF